MTEEPRYPASRTEGRRSAAGPFIQTDAAIIRPRTAGRRGEYSGRCDEPVVRCLRSRLPSAKRAFAVSFRRVQESLIGRVEGRSYRQAHLRC
jgi:hypothetical protein